MLSGDVDLGHLALQACAGVEQDHPAEAQETAVLVPHREHHVLAGEPGPYPWELGFDLLPAELRMLGKVDLLVEVKVHEERLDQVQLLRGQPFDAVAVHRPDAKPRARLAEGAVVASPPGRLPSRRRRSSAGRAAAS